MALTEAQREQWEREVEVVDRMGIVDGLASNRVFLVVREVEVGLTRVAVFPRSDGHKAARALLKLEARQPARGKVKPQVELYAARHIGSLVRAFPALLDVPVATMAELEGYASPVAASEGTEG